MKQTKGSIGNLLNRYRAVLKKCALLNAFGSLAVVSLLVAGNVAPALAAPAQHEGVVVSFTGTELLPATSSEQNLQFELKDNAVKMTATEQESSKYGVLSNLYKDGTTDVSSSAALIVQDSTFTSNKNTGNGSGGGAVSIFSENAKGTLQHQIINSIFSENTAENGYGGAVAAFNWDAVDVTLDEHTLIIKNSKFEKNKALYGGALSIDKFSSTTDENTTFDSNSSTQFGGAVYVRYDGNFTANGTNFTNNNSAYGGAIYNDNSTVTINGGTLSGNSAANGGAIYNAQGDVTIKSGTSFNENISTALNYGGGAIHSRGGSVTIEDNVTFNQNYLNQPETTDPSNGEHRSAGGAIAAWDSTKLTIGKNVIFSNNGYNDAGEAAWASGGAIYLDSDGTKLAEMTIGEKSKFEGNVAGSLGGAIYAADSKTSIESAVFSGNEAGSYGGAIFAGKYKEIEGESFQVNNSEFSNNTAGNYGGAIAVDYSNTAIANSTFTGNTVTADDGKGGAIYNNGNLTLTGENTFSNNNVADTPNDIYNEGIITIANGVTTLNSGYIQAQGDRAQVDAPSLTVSAGGTLDMASGSTLAINDGTLTLNGGTFASDVDLLLKDDYTTADGITDAKIVGTAGNLNLRLENGKEYTIDEYTAAHTSLLGQDNENAVLNFLNGNLKLQDGQSVVVGATKDETGAVTITSTTPVVVNDNEAPTEGDTFHGAHDQVVAVVSNNEAKDLLSTDNLTIQGSTFSAQALKVGNSADQGVTLNLKGGSEITLAGNSLKDTGVVNSAETAIQTSATIEADSTLNMGLPEDDTADQGLTLTNVSVSGTLNANGTQNTTSEYAISDTLTMNTGSQVNVTNSTMNIAKLDAQGGTMFVDPAYVNIQEVKGDTFGTKLLVSTGSVVNIGNMNEGDLREAMAQAGMTAGSALTAPNVNAVLAVATPLTLGQDGKIVVDAQVKKDGTINGIAPASDVHFGDGSLLVVNADMGDAAAITAAEGANQTATVAKGSTLKLVNAKATQDVTILSGFDSISDGNDGKIGWSKVSNPDRMLTSTVEVKASTTAANKNDAVVTNTVNTASSALPGLDSAFDPVMRHLWTSGGNDVESLDPGVRFLSRAARSDYMPDAHRAASTIESAARIAFAGAVPQMTKMASDAATNAVVNRMGFANPENGAKAMNVEGQLVPDKALGLALWIAPLWSNQTGFGMEAGNLDYGYRANLGGVSLGADYTWANNFRAGLMFNIGGGYAQTDGGDLSDTTNSMTFWGIGAYGGWQYENFAVMGDVSYTSTWNSVDQDVDSGMQMGDLEADIQASALSAGLRLEYKLETSVLDLIPHIGVRYMSINTWGYDVDSDMGTVLEGDGFQQNIWTFPVGITFSKELEMNDSWYFKPSLDFTVIPAAGDIKAKEDVRFTGLPYSTQIETQMMDYFTWQGGVGVEFGNDNMSVGVNYTLQAGQNSTSHGVFGMFRYEF